MNRSLTMIVHGPSKVGKSTLAATAPAPRLILDAEGGSKFLPVQAVSWDGMDRPPVPDGTWDTCVVRVRDYATMQRVYQWLEIGQHPFTSVILDSVSEIQQRAIDSIAGVNQMTQPDWGTLLRQMSDLIRKFRDLCDHPSHPIACVVLVAMTQDRDGKWRPMLQGQLRDTLPYYLDLVGYLFLADDGAGGQVRQLLTRQHPQYEAGERVQGRVPAIVTNPNIEELITMVYGPQIETEAITDATA